MDPDTSRSSNHSATQRSRVRSVAGNVALGAGLVLLLVSGIALIPSFDAAAGWFGRHARGHGHGHDAESMREHSEFAVEWMLRRVDGTDAQQERVAEIVGSLIDQLPPLAEEHRARREAFVAELVRPEIDRDRLEELRNAELELADRASRQIVVALSDVAETLTPEQRLELLEFAERRRH